MQRSSADLPSQTAKHQASSPSISIHLHLFRGMGSSSVFFLFFFLFLYLYFLLLGGAGVVLCCVGVCLVSRICRHTSTLMLKPREILHPLTIWNGSHPMIPTTHVRLKLVYTYMLIYLISFTFYGRILGNMSGKGFVCLISFDTS